MFKGESGLTSVTKFLAGVMLVSSLGLVSGPSLAQGLSIGPGGVRVDPGYRRDDRGYRGDDDISRGDAVRIARRAGLVDLDNVGRRGPRFVVRGSDRRGDDITVIVDSRTGDVIDVAR
jgi:hypothetical protein